MVKIISNGNYNITYKNIDYSFESGNSYELDEETAKLFVENKNCNYIKTEKKDDVKSKKTYKNIK